MFFNIGFWFSISGVFFIFFYLEFIKKGFILFNFWVLFAMMPIIHYFFPYFYFLQLFSPIWNILFLIFYPFSFFLHLIGMGDFLDGILIYFLNLGNNTILTQEFQISTPLTILIIYLSIFFLFIFLKKKSSYN
jgi:competence protein ComEC